MKHLPDVFERNRAWAEERVGDDPEFFSRLVHLQRPDLLWIGCSDSRVPANEIVGLAPGELFVHRNVANVVPETDLNALAVLEYAVTAPWACGTSSSAATIAAAASRRRSRATRPAPWPCGCSRSATSPTTIARNWTRSASEDASWDRLCELNVVAQVRALARTEIVESAWDRGADLAVHGWIYDLEDGLLRDLGVTVGGPARPLAAEDRPVPLADRVHCVAARTGPRS